MKTISAELKVGIFVVVVILILSYMTFKVEDLGIVWKKGYRLYVVFENVMGLEEKSRIKVAGVDSGIVEKIRLKEGKAELTILMEPQVKIHKDAKASIRMTGLLGDKYLAIWAGSPAESLLKDGDVITYTEPAIDIDMLASELTSAASHISNMAEVFTDIFGEPEKKAVQETIHNLKTIAKNLNEILKENREPLHKTLVKLEGFSEDISRIAKDLENFSKKLGEKGPGLVDDVSKVARDLKEVIEENRVVLKDSMENIKTFSASAGRISERIERGEGTLGKLLKDDKLYDSFTKTMEGAGKSVEAVDRLRTFINFRTEYLTREGDWKGYFDLTLQPRKDKYYILGVTTDPKGMLETIDTTTGGVTTREEKVKSRIEFTAQFAKRIEDFAMRIGMLESTFGVGADYFFKDDRGKISFDVWDFSANEAKAKRAHAKIGMDYKIFKYFFVTGGLDNLLNPNRRGIYVGGGLKFEDEDLKYIFGTAPRLPVP